MNSDIGSRIREAVVLRGMSLRALGRTLSKRSVRGSSYAMIHRYMSGKTAPALPFLQAVAELMDVRLEWLAAGSGGMTAADERAEREREAALKGLDRQYGEEGIRETFPAYDKLNFITRSALLQAWTLHFGMSYLEHRLGPIMASDHAMQREVGRRIGRTVRAGLIELAIDVQHVRVAQMNNYVLGLANALFALSDSADIRAEAENPWGETW